MFNKINVLQIIKDHFFTLKNNQNDKLSLADVATFILLPLVISVLLVQLKIYLNDGVSNALITSFSVFSALLFNLLLLIYGLVEKENERAKREKEKTYPSQDDLDRIRTKVSILREVYSNISFCILISIVTTIALLINFLKTDSCIVLGINTCSFQWLLALFVYYLTSQFLLTLFMVLKRIYKLLFIDFKVVH